MEETGVQTSAPLSPLVTRRPDNGHALDGTSMGPGREDDPLTDATRTAVGVGLAAL